MTRSSFALYDKKHFDVPAFIFRDSCVQHETDAKLNAISYYNAVQMLLLAAHCNL
jgi:hypothetical protein